MIDKTKLFGTIQTPPRSYYEPANTDTINMTITPDRVIKADLNPELHQTIHNNVARLVALKDLLAKTRDELDQLQQQHNEDRDNLERMINANYADLISKISEVYAFIADEIVRVQKIIDQLEDDMHDADKALDLRIDSEIEARIQADNVLQQNIDAEAAARKAGDDTLQDNLDAEEKARKDKDDELEAAIQDEEARAIAAETLIQDNLDKFIDETYTPTVNGLQDQLNGVNSDLSTHIKEFSDHVDAYNMHISDYTTFKSEYAETLAELEAANAGFTTKFETIESTLETLNATDNAINQEIDNLADALSNLTSIVSNETDGHGVRIVALEETVSDLTNSTAAGFKDLQQKIDNIEIESGVGSLTILRTDADREAYFEGIETDAQRAAAGTICIVTDIENYPAYVWDGTQWLPIGSMTGGGSGEIPENVLSYVGSGSYSEMEALQDAQSGALFLVTDYDTITNAYLPFLCIGTSITEYGDGSTKTEPIWQQIGSIKDLHKKVNSLETDVANFKSIEFIDANLAIAHLFTET